MSTSSPSHPSAIMGTMNQETRFVRVRAPFALARALARDHRRPRRRPAARASGTASAVPSGPQDSRFVAGVVARGRLLIFHARVLFGTCYKVRRGEQARPAPVLRTRRRAPLAAPANSSRSTGPSSTWQIVRAHLFVTAAHRGPRSSRRRAASFVVALLARPRSPSPARLRPRRPACPSAPRSSLLLVPPTRATAAVLPS